MSDVPTRTEIALRVVQGAFFDLGQPSLQLWYHARDLPAGPGHVQLPRDLSDGQVSLLCRRHADLWQEETRPVAAAGRRAIREALEALDLPGRAPDVEPTLDTSDVWSQLHLDVTCDERSRQLDLTLYASGYEGPDADALARLMVTLFGLTGRDVHSPVLNGLRTGGLDLDAPWPLAYCGHCGSAVTPHAPRDGFRGARGPLRHDPTLDTAYDCPTCARSHDAPTGEETGRACRRCHFHVPLRMKHCGRCGSRCA